MKSLISYWQGAHQLAQKLSMITQPLHSAQIVQLAVQPLNVNRWQFPGIVGFGWQRYGNST
ncbi:MAG: hypothetical protein P1R74_08620 [Sedimenticola sp.]|nr:hypothetical protein [Sedimenticola sp.]